MISFKTFRQLLNGNNVAIRNLENFKKYWLDSVECDVFDEYMIINIESYEKGGTTWVVVDLLLCKEDFDALEEQGIVEKI